ncbi:MAG: prepilin-type N-terminal cleavage/methylation domain-containing protein [Chloroflexi bacterium]|nr:prepilin-type N-terminal cleavage/methylation domain-containing protein [Chloroflexota bacterium]
MPSNRPTSQQAGFTLIELLIGMVIAIEILVAALTVFDVHNRMARVQLQITDMQQSLRVASYDMARTTRMAGRGGLPLGLNLQPAGLLSVPWLRGRAIEVRNNVLEGGDDAVAIGIDEPVALPGTDILTVRGCISGLLLQLEPADYNVGGTLTIRRDLANGRSQDLTELLVDGFSSPMLLQSSVDPAQFAIAEVRGATGDADSVLINFTYASGLTPPNPWITAPQAGFLPGFACALEEYRYYVRPTFVTDANGDQQLRPRLARARMIPGTELPHDEEPANLTLDLADDIFDLQVALGLDTANNGAFNDDANADGGDDIIFEAATDADRADDDWLYNSSEDDPTDGVYLAPLYYARITALARTAQRDPKYAAPDFDPAAGEDYVEDNNYDEDPAKYFKSDTNRQFRHRQLQTVVDLRNI